MKPPPSTYVRIPYRNSSEAGQWAMANCPSYVTRYAVSWSTEDDDEGEVEFMFGTERDAIMFSLRWSS